MRQLFEKLIPFIILGVAIVAFAFGMIILAYLFLFGALIGFILFLITAIRNKFFPPKSITPKSKNKPGKIIDTDDWHRL